MKRYLLQVLSVASVAFLLPVVSARAQEGSPAAGQDPAAAEEDDRISYTFKLDTKSGGGQATLSAGDLEYLDGQYVIATGGVDFKYQGLRLQAEVARIDIPTNLLTAEGNVILDEGPQRLIGETIEYDLGTRTGKVTEATAFVESEYYFTGSLITKTGDETFTVDDGMLTSCSQDVPSWSIYLSSARITLEEYARIKNARLKFKKVPVFYAPYIVWPANTERASGLLVPKPGYSERRGFDEPAGPTKLLAEYQKSATEPKRPLQGASATQRPTGAKSRTSLAVPGRAINSHTGGKVAAWFPSV